MGFLKEIFDDIVDIAFVPVKVVGKVADDIIETELENYAKELKKTIKN